MTGLLRRGLLSGLVFSNALIACGGSESAPVSPAADTAGTGAIGADSSGEPIGLDVSTEVFEAGDAGAVSDSEAVSDSGAAADGALLEDVDPSDTVAADDTLTSADSGSGDDADLSLDVDFGDTDPGDTGPGDVSGGADVVTVPTGPGASAWTGWSLTFSDDFDGPKAGDPCYDAAVTPAMCLDRYWSVVPCPPEVQTQLAALNKCVWSVYDIYNWMDFSKPLGYGINNLDPGEVSIEDGELHLRARWKSGGTKDCGKDLVDGFVNKSCPIRSGAITSQKWANTPGFQQQYGRFEVRAILPAGPGAWPAHWLLPQGGGWPDAGEIDIMEALGSEPTTSQGNYHGGTIEGDVRTHYSVHFERTMSDTRFTDDWHVYAAEWSPGSLRFFIDDLEIGRITEGLTAPATVIGAADSSQVGKAVGDRPVQLPTMPFFFILNTSVVPIAGLNGSNLNIFGTLDHRIDYVKVYAPCSPGAAGCLPRPPNSRDLTRTPWMTASKWSTQYRETTLGDFNGDGRTDLLLQTKSAGNATYLMLADGQGGLEPEQVVTDAFGMSEAAWSAEHRRLLTGDFDGDGRDDVLLQGRTESDATLLLRANNTPGATGVFHGVADLSTTPWMSQAKWAGQYRTGHVGDFDGDGRDDVLLQTASPGSATYLLLANESAGFKPELTPTADFGMTEATWSAEDRVLATGDFNGDDRTDVLLQGKTAAESTLLLLAQGAGAFAPVADLSTSTGVEASRWSAAGHTLLTGDFDGDGRTDVILQAHDAFKDTRLLRFDAAGKLEPSVSLDNVAGMNAGLWAAGTRKAMAADFDGDGRTDILLQPHGNGAANTTLLLLARPAGVFAPVQDLTNDHVMDTSSWDSATHALHAGDFDGDGKADVFLQNRSESDGTLLLYLHL